MPTTKRRARLPRPRQGYNSIEFSIPMEPVACPRPRMNRSGDVFYPPRYERWRSAAAIHVPIPPAPLDGALAVYLCHVLPPFKSVVRDFPRGDVDNYAKSVLDLVTNRGGIWSDDNQVVSLVSDKRFTTGSEQPHSYVYIWETTPQ